MAESSGIRYVPRHKRRQRPERLHGAFAGGFSAGYFNSVGSKEGWQPKPQLLIRHGDEQEEQEESALVAAAAAAEDNKDEIGDVQKIEDFMDEHDHNEWGGPQNVRQDLAGRKLATREKQAIRSTVSLHETVFGMPPPSASASLSAGATEPLIPSQNVGSRLLQKLGWKEGSSSAYVPNPTTVSSLSLSSSIHHNNSSNGNSNNNHLHLSSQNDAIEEALFLSQRRLRKIRVQQEHIQIPRPKLDQVGLGFEAHANAPEFQAFREKQRKLAQERAQGSARHRKVYRLSNVLAAGSDNHPLQITAMDHRDNNSNQDDNNGDINYESYEVMEDFVGSRTVGGFALRDDEDDAFDDAEQGLTKISDKILLDKEQYNTVIEDPHSDDDDNDNLADNGHGGRAADLAQGFTAWMDATSTTETLGNSETPVVLSMTSDGRPPLAGFVLGSSRGSVLQRFRGPDIPEGYHATPHVFREEEHPLVWKTLARAVQLENDENRKKEAIRDALEMNRVKKQPSQEVKMVDKTTPMAGAAFASLASAMKNRFTSAAATDDVATQDDTALAPGLTHASALPKKSTQDLASANVAAIRNFTVSRSVQAFAPAPLVCKRFGVRPPTLHSTALVPQGANLSKEETYFQEEILGAAQKAKTSSLTTRTLDTMNNDVGESTPDIFANRPSMDVYRSIFGVQESDDSGEDDDEQLESDRAPTITKKDTVDHLEPDRSKETFASKAQVEKATLPREEKYTWSSDSSLDQAGDVVVTEKKSSKRPDDDRKERKRRKDHKRKKKKKYRKRDRSSSSLSDNDDDDQETDDSVSYQRRRRRKHQRKEDRKRKDKEPKHRSKREHDASVN